MFPGGKGGRCVGLTTLPPSCADCLEIWEHQPPGTINGNPVMGLLYLYKVPSCWLFLLIHTTMNGSMNIKFKNYEVSHYVILASFCYSLSLGSKFPPRCTRTGDRTSYQCGTKCEGTSKKETFWFCLEDLTLKRRSLVPSKSPKSLKSSGCLP